MPKALQLSHQDLFRMGDTKQRKKKKKLKDSNFPQNLNQKGESQKQSLGKASFNT